jgi:hypothetical protein
VLKGVLGHFSSAVAPGGPTLDEFALPGVELIGKVRTGVKIRRMPDGVGGRSGALDRQMQTAMNREKLLVI